MKLLSVLVLLFCCQSITTSGNESTEVKVFYDHCRYRNNIEYPLDLFPLITCAECYSFTPPYRFKAGQKLNPKPIAVQSQEDGKTYRIPAFLINDRYFFADRYDSNVTNFMSNTFSASNERSKWLSCCESAEKCCQKMITTPPSYQPHCPRTWDGWLCWEDGSIGGLEKERCPRFIQTGDPPSCQLYALKECRMDGTWFFSPTLGEFTNYTCSIDDWVEIRTVFHIAVHSVSLVFSIPAIVIFCYFRALKNHRFIIHCNLIIALCLHSIAVILVKAAVVLGEFEAEANGESIVAQNGVLCRIAVWFDKFANMAVFTWMLCEGIYLHQIIAAAFQEEKKLFVFFIIGWVLPLIPSLSWATAMAVQKDFACWVAEVGDNDNLIWIMDSFRLSALLINAILLGNIVRVLFTKLRAVNTSTSTHIRKMVKATIFLIPVFGTQFFITGIKPSTESCISEQIYYYFAYLFDGFHGLVVSVVYCYLNSEVQQQVRKKLTKSRTPFQKNRGPNRGYQARREGRAANRRESNVTEVSSVDSNTNATYTGYSESENQGENRVEIHSEPGANGTVPQPEESDHSNREETPKEMVVVLNDNEKKEDDITEA